MNPTNIDGFTSVREEWFRNHPAWVGKGSLQAVYFGWSKGRGQMAKEVFDKWHQSGPNEFEAYLDAIQEATNE